MRLAQELVAGQNNLASLPNLYYKVREALADPDIDFPRLAELIAADPALTATLLRMANSAFYGFPRKIETLSRSLSLIGLEQVGDIVLAGALASTFQGIRPHRMDMARFWRGSIRRALLCRQFARHLGSRDTEHSFVIGLLSDTGHLVMYHAVPDLVGIVLDAQCPDMLALAAQERIVIGCDFAEVGAALCTAWLLPTEMGLVVGSQLEPEMAGNHAAEAARLNLAVAVAEALEEGETISAATPALPASIIELAGVDLALLPVFAEHCEAQLESVMSSLGVA